MDEQELKKLIRDTGSDLTKKYQFHLEPQRWEKNYRDFLQNSFLNRCFSKPKGKNERKLREKMVSDEYMSLWIALVTDPTYRPDVNENYNRIEHFGDRSDSQKTSFLVYKKHPEFTEDDVSNIEKRYLSKEQQAQWAYEHGIVDYYRGFLTLSVDIQEDLFESTTGGIVLVGNMVSPGLGEILLQNFMFNLFKDIDLSKTTKDPNTRFKDIMETMNWVNGPNYVEDIRIVGKGNVVTYALYLPTKAYIEIKKEKDQKLAQPFVEITARIEQDRGPVKASLYEQALEKLDKLGYNREQILEERKQTNRLISKEMKEKLQEENLTELKFQDYRIKRKDGQDFIYSLTANQEDRRIVLYIANIDLTSKVLSRDEIYELLESNFLEDERKHPKVREIRRSILRYIKG